MSTSRLGRDRERNRDLFRDRNRERIKLRDPIKLEETNRERTSTQRTNLRVPTENDTYNGPRSADVDLNRTTFPTTAQMSNGTWPTTGFQNGSSLGNNAWGSNVNGTNGVAGANGGRLNSPAAIRSYFEERSKSLPPTAESLEQIAKEVAQQGGIIAIATHAGGKLQSDDAIVLEDGSCIDVIGSVGGPDAKWQWLHHGQAYGSTYDPSRNVVDPATGEFKTWGDFISGKGRPVPPYVPLIDDGGQAADGSEGLKMNHIEGWGVDADKVKKRMDEMAAARSFQPMKNFDAAKLNDPNETDPMYFFARWMQAAGLEPTMENLAKFIKANPDWEMDAQNNIRIKPEALKKYPGHESAGQWHKAISNDGTGPAWDFKPLAPGTATATAANDNVIPFTSSSRRQVMLRV